MEEGEGEGEGGVVLRGVVVARTVTMYKADKLIRHCKQ